MIRMNKEQKEKIKRNLNIRGAIKLIAYPFRPIRDVLGIWHSKYLACTAQRHYLQVAHRIKSEHRAKRYAAYVMYASSYGGDALFQEISSNPGWCEAKVVVIPDVMRGESHMLQEYNETKEFFIKKYGRERVIDGYDAKNGVFLDCSAMFDVIYCACPYDHMASRVHSIRYLSTQNVLPIYITYGFEAIQTVMEARLKSFELSFMWKCFTDTAFSLRDYQKYQLIHGKNACLTGYAKMDGLAGHIGKQKGPGKTVLIAPHHTVAMKMLPMSNFLDYYRLILKLPEFFPEVKFVFRPHALLFVTLVNEHIWTQDMVAGYLKKIQEAGIEYSYGGDYFELFNRCDAIVHDCGSFIVEWLYTGKPGCFVYREALDETYFTELGKQALKHYTIARSEEDIIRFIKQAVMGGGAKAPRQKQRRWVREQIMVNYPYASKKILEEIESAIMENG